MVNRVALNQSTEIVGQLGQTRLVPLTGFRFLAAILVVCHHFCHFFTANAPVQPGPLRLVFIALGNVTLSGFVGVDFFFILSGFILVYTYIEADGTLRGDRRSFWIARFARVYPVYLLGFCLAALPFLWDHTVLAPTSLVAATTLTLTQAWVPYLSNLWNPPAWSLSVEAVFYLLFPLLIPSIAHLRRRQLYVIIAVLGAISCTISLVYLAADTPVTGLIWGRESLWIRVMEFNPLLRLPQFLIGMALGRLFILTRRAETPQSWWQRPDVQSNLAFSGIVVCLAFGTLIPHVLLNHGPLDLLFALLIYGVAQSQGRLAKFFALPFVALLGEASYSIYILHFPLWEWLVHLSGIPSTDALNSVLFFAIYLCITVIVSLTSFRYVEKPARAAIKRAFQVRPNKAEAVALNAKPTR